MGGSSFDLLMQELTKHQRIMATLQEENWALRRQLADLRAGHGIVLEILGKRFTLTGEALTTSPAQETTGAASTDSPIHPASAQAETKPSTAKDAPVSPSQATTTTSSEAEATSAPQEQRPAKAPTFLEEMMISQFETAMTTPQAIWTGPVKKPELSDEEQRAALRRELKGSFLLE